MYTAIIQYVNDVIESRNFSSRRKAKRWVYSRPIEKKWNMNHDPIMVRHYTPVQMCIIDSNSHEEWLKITPHYTLEYAKALIDSYLMNEYDDDACGNFDNLTRVSLAYTEFEDEAFPVISAYAYVDLIHNTMVYEYNVGECIEVRKTEYPSLSELIKMELEWLNFDSLVSLPDDLDVRSDE